MNVRIKLSSRQLVDIRQDLARPHPFAFERVGFLTAGMTLFASDDLVLLGRTYQPVADEDYVRDSTVGARIGGSAMRKALERAYRQRSALLHIHTHSGRGRPEFSWIDLKSGRDFVPGFFHSVPQMAHGMLVLSKDSATGLLWLGPEDQGRYVAEFVVVGAPYRKFRRQT